MSDRREFCHYAIKDTPGLYCMVREIMVGGKWKRNEMIVHNPAYAAAILNVWEETVRAEAMEPKTVMRVSALGRAKQRAA